MAALDLSSSPLFPLSQHLPPIPCTHWCPRSIACHCSRSQGTSSTGELTRTNLLAAGHCVRRSELHHGCTLLEHFLLSVTSVELLFDVSVLHMKQVHQSSSGLPGMSSPPPSWTRLSASHVASPPRAIPALTNSTAVFMMSHCSFPDSPFNLYHRPLAEARAPLPPSMSARRQTCPARHHRPSWPA